MHEIAKWLAHQDHPVPMKAHHPKTLADDTNYNWPKHSTESQLQNASPAAERMKHYQFLWKKGFLTNHQAPTHQPMLLTTSKQHSTPVTHSASTILLAWTTGQLKAAHSNPPQHADI